MSSTIPSNAEIADMIVRQKIKNKFMDWVKSSPSPKRLRVRLPVDYVLRTGEPDVASVEYVINVIEPKPRPDYFAITASPRTLWD
jgi:hypothetical protein